MTAVFRLMVESLIGLLLPGGLDATFLHNRTAPSSPGQSRCLRMNNEKRAKVRLAKIVVRIMLFATAMEAVSNGEEQGMLSATPKSLEVGSSETPPRCSQLTLTGLTTRGAGG
jgi:hypothetical protein